MRGRRNSRFNLPDVPRAYSLRHRDPVKVFPVTGSWAETAQNPSGRRACLRNENNPAGLLSTRPSRLHFRQRHTFHVNAQLASCSHFKELGNRGKDAVQRNRTETAPQNPEVNAAQRRTLQSDGLSRAFANFHKPCSPRRGCFESLCERLKHQLRRSTPKVVDNDVNSFGSLRSQRLPNRVFRLGQRNDRVYITTVTGVQVFDAKGQYLGTIKAGRQAANVAFGGPDKQTLYFTAREGLYRVKTLAQGPDRLGK